MSKVIWSLVQTSWLLQFQVWFLNDFWVYYLDWECLCVYALVTWTSRFCWSQYPFERTVITADIFGFNLLQNGPYSGMACKTPNHLQWTRLTSSHELQQNDVYMSSAWQKPGIPHDGLTLTHVPVNVEMAATEMVAARMRAGRNNAIFAVVYRSGSQRITQRFFPTKCRRCSTRCPASNIPCTLLGILTATLKGQTTLIESEWLKR